MEEELSENELEGRMYAMLHYVDETQINVGLHEKEASFIDNVTHSTLRRYWHTNSDQCTPYQKRNTPKEPTTDKKVLNSNYNKEKNDENNLSASPDLSIFQQPVPKNIKKTVEILENEDLNRVVELESSDEDEVIEVTLPPKPTITIESSDEEESVVIPKHPAEKKVVEKVQENKAVGNREVTASPVPSVVSSISDEFIRGDCIALNISSKHANNQSFDFSLHGSDLLVQTPTRKKKKKRNKDTTSTPIVNPATTLPVSVDECFATPKGKAKNKRQRKKSYHVSEQSVPNADVYDSDSNQSTNDGNKNPYSVTDNVLPITDIYESDTNQAEITKDAGSSGNVVTKEVISPNTSSAGNSITSIPKATSRTNDTLNDSVVVDLTEFDNVNTTISENIIIGNVSGFTEMDEYSDENTNPQDVTKCGSTKIPAILNEDLDFDNLKGNTRVCKRRRYSLTTLRAEMEKFYNESWGGEDFNHREIQKNMSRDKNLWVIDPKDRNSSLSKRKSTCNYCNRVGHRDDTCRMKPPVCFMCGSAGHFEPRCPKKICVNCGSPNHMYSTMCRNCCNWSTMTCVECGQNGHPSSHCPDIWRRYHNTVNLDMPLEENRQSKKYYQTYCSGCTRRGHFVHTCRVSLPFSGLPINSPHVAVYRPIYTQLDTSLNSGPNNNRNKQNKNKSGPHDANLTSALTSRTEHLKRHSKSPVNHDTHLNKKKNFGTPDDALVNQRTKSPITYSSQKKNTQNKEHPTTATEQNKNVKTSTVFVNQTNDKARDLTTISSENHDKSGHIIQDNEVSDTSDVVTSARIYITKEIAEKLKKDGSDTWMKEATKKNNIILENDNITFYLSIRGTVGNQEAFQVELRDWINAKQQNNERLASESEADITQELNNSQCVMINDIPKNRNNVLRKLNRAFETLNTDLGDPKTLYKELVYFQNRHQQLLKQKVVSPQQLSNNRTNINGMLKKLNMVLLGQAGLADGSRHLTELHQLQEKLTSYRQKNIPTSMREEIGQHFHLIFTATQRDDYVDLLSKYYNKPTSTIKKKHNTLNYRAKINKANNKIHNLQRIVNTRDQSNVAEQKGTQSVAKTMRNKLIFYHRRLLHSKPIDVILKKTRNKLIGVLHSQIASLGQNTHMYVSNENFKKMKKIQEQVQMFLSNV